MVNNIKVVNTNRLTAPSCTSMPFFFLMPFESHVLYTNTNPFQSESKSNSKFCGYNSFVFHHVLPHMAESLITLSSLRCF